MNRSAPLLLLVGMAVAFSAAACNYPGISAPTPFVFPTSNLALTAVFTPTDGLPATVVAPSAAIPTNTVTIDQDATHTPPASPISPSYTPTQTFVPPTAILAPTLTPVPPTPTRVLTQTPIPTVSYAGPGSRNGPSQIAAYQNQPLTIDGVFDDWEIERYGVGSIVAGAVNWNGEADLSARVMWSWDENNLYLAARVKDDVYVQNASGDQIYKGDSLEIFMDTNVSTDFYRQALDADDYQLGISPGSSQPGNSPEAYLWYPQAEAGTRQKVKVGAMPVEDGYRIEASIPWNIFGVNPKSGQHLGFAFSVSDNDKPGDRVQQSMVSNVATRSLTDPTTWGDLALSSSPARASNPQKRPGPSVNAVYFDQPPSLNTDFADWGQVSYPINQVAYGNDQWSNLADLSGNFKAGWDDDYLYLRVQVYDDRYVQNAKGQNLFKGDSLEILFDVNVPVDYYEQSLSGDDHQLGISPGSPGPGITPEAYLWFPQSNAGSRPQVRIAATATVDGYIVEAAIPWEIFGVLPAHGQHYGFAISISDNDQVERDVQQSMISNVARRGLTDPTTWGDLTLSQP